MLVRGLGRPPLGRRGGRRRDVGVQRLGFLHADPADGQRRRQVRQPEDPQVRARGGRREVAGQSLPELARPGHAGGERRHGHDRQPRRHGHLRRRHLRRHLRRHARRHVRRHALGVPRDGGLLRPPAVGPRVLPGDRDPLRPGPGRPGPGVEPHVLPGDTAPLGPARRGLGSEARAQAQLPADEAVKDAGRRGGGPQPGGAQPCLGGQDRVDHRIVRRRDRGDGRGTRHRAEVGLEEIAK
mmetsp:Transcript_21179/g.49727  ORF Transcript_21179/g.49727 Transcript_21179/m.49727 type:complete len:240 (-) Transcript_21179:1391-2110(-)